MKTIDDQDVPQDVLTRQEGSQDHLQILKELKTREVNFSVGVSAEIVPLLVLFNHLSFR